MQLTDYKLADLLGAAGATIGIIIAATIFMQFLSGKYLEVLNRYRDLTKEYRQGGVEKSRHNWLQPQIRNYRRRLQLISRASWLACLAVTCFIVAVLAGGISKTYPDAYFANATGVICLFVGLVLWDWPCLLNLSKT